MHKPTLVTPPADPLITLEETKAHLRVESNDDDDYISSLISAVTHHLDGWSGYLGICLVSQEWQQKFDRLDATLRLPVGPVLSVQSIEITDSAGVTSIVPVSDYKLLKDAVVPCVKFINGFGLSGNLAEFEAVSVKFRAGFGGVSDVPDDIKHAVKLIIGSYFAHRETFTTGTIVQEFPQSAQFLLMRHRSNRGI